MREAYGKRAFPGAFPAHQKDLLRVVGAYDLRNPVPMRVRVLPQLGRTDLISLENVKLAFRVADIPKAFRSVIASAEHHVNLLSDLRLDDVRILLPILLRIGSLCLCLVRDRQKLHVADMLCQLVKPPVPDAVINLLPVRPDT